MYTVSQKKVLKFLQHWTENETANKTFSKYWPLW